MKKTSITRPNDDLIWAIRLGDFVELRQANQLIKKVSKLTRIMKVEVGWDYWTNRMLTEKKPVTLKQVSFIGGEVLGYMKTASFRRVFGFVPGKDDAQKLDKHMRAIIQRVGWRARNLR